MSTATNIGVVILFIAELIAGSVILHHEGWKKGFYEGWCHAQPAGTRC